MSIQTVTVTASVLVVILSGIWLWQQPGYEPLTVLIATVGTLVGSYVAPNRKRLALATMVCLLAVSAVGIWIVHKSNLTKTPSEVNGVAGESPEPLQAEPTPQEQNPSEITSLSDSVISQTNQQGDNVGIVNESGSVSIDMSEHNTTTTSSIELPVHCKVVGQQEGRCRPIQGSPGLLKFGGIEEYDCVNNGTDLDVIALVPGGFFGFYQLTAYSYDDGPFLVTAVAPNSPAEEIGLQIGDEFLSVDQLDLQQERKRSTFTEYISAHAGQEVVLVVRRNNEMLTKAVVPRANPPEGQGAIGFSFSGGIESREFPDGQAYIASVAVSCPVAVSQ